MSISESLLQTVESLSSTSVKHRLSPYQNIEWPERLSEDAWIMSPELVALSAHPLWKSLSERVQKKVSFYECLNFFALNIHGEKALIQGLAERLYRKDCEEISKYLHHFLDEENNHMVYFGTFCEKYGKKVYADRKFNFQREYLPGEEDFLFFSKIVVFEEIVDVYNLKMSKDDRLDPLSKEINRRHHFDEARHLVFGRRIVKELFERYSTSWGSSKISEISQYMKSYIEATSREYVNPDVYQDAGLNNPYEIVESLFSSEVWRTQMQERSQNASNVFRDIGLFQRES